MRKEIRGSNFLAYQVEPKLVETLVRLGEVDNETTTTQTDHEGSTEAATINQIDQDATETTPSLSGMLMVNSWKTTRILKWKGIFGTSWSNFLRTLLRKSNFLAYQVEPKLVESLVSLGEADNETTTTQTDQEGSAGAATINQIVQDITETTPTLSGLLNDLAMT